MSYKKEAKIDLESRRALKALGIEIGDPEPLYEDLSYGLDKRRDEAMFIERYHISGWEVDEAVKAVAGDMTVFFRVIENGLHTSSHGWIEGGKIVQWG